MIKKSNQTGSSDLKITFDKMDDVKEVVNGMDRRLGLHINIVAENLGKVAQMVEELHNAIIFEDKDPDLKSRSKATGYRRTKIDLLLSNMPPLIGVRLKSFNID